jgi:2-keto-4-pentenoate hydratase/2-oxohepta-3-ene-1,7-dioic acid hydratase in catechol pathway
MPRSRTKLDYEELAFVIGKRCRHVPKERAREVIAGYLICNDVSVRDWRQRADHDARQVVGHTARSARGW